MGVETKALPISLTPRTLPLPHPAYGQRPDVPAHLFSACGDSVEDLFQEYPSVTGEDILACFDYVASLAEEQVSM